MSNTNGTIRVNFRKKVSVACQTDPSPTYPEGVDDAKRERRTTYTKSSPVKNAGGSTEPTTSWTGNAGTTTRQTVPPNEDHTLRVTIQHFSKMSDTLCSPSKRIKDVPWRIMVMPKQHMVQKKSQKCMGFFLQCCPDNTYSDQWSCQAVAEMRLISQKTGVQNFVRKTTHVYTAKENDWGYSCFMTWADVLDESQGYIKEDRVTLEITVKADSPKNMLSVEEFRKTIDQWFQIAEMHMTRGHIDLAIEANTQALKYCKDKDRQSKDKLDAQKERLVKHKLLESIQRIELGKDPNKPPETAAVSATSLRQALTGAQKTTTVKAGDKRAVAAKKKAAVAKSIKKKIDNRPPDAKRRLSDTSDEDNSKSTEPDGEAVKVERKDDGAPQNNVDVAVNAIEDEAKDLSVPVEKKVSNASDGSGTAAGEHKCACNGDAHWERVFGTDEIQPHQPFEMYMMERADKLSMFMSEMIRDSDLESSAFFEKMKETKRLGGWDKRKKLIESLIRSAEGHEIPLDSNKPTGRTIRQQLEIIHTTMLDVDRDDGDMGVTTSDETDSSEYGEDASVKDMCDCHGHGDDDCVDGEDPADCDLPVSSEEEDEDEEECEDEMDEEDDYVDEAEECEEREPVEMCENGCQTDDTVDQNAPVSVFAKAGQKNVEHLHETNMSKNAPAMKVNATLRNATFNHLRSNGSSITGHKFASVLNQLPRNPEGSEQMTALVTTGMSCLNTQRIIMKVEKVVKSLEKALNTKLVSDTIERYKALKNSGQLLDVADSSVRAMALEESSDDDECGPRKVRDIEALLNDMNEASQVETQLKQAEEEASAGGEKMLKVLFHKELYSYNCSLSTMSDMLTVFDQRSSELEAAVAQDVSLAKALSDKEALVKDLETKLKTSYRQLELEKEQRKKVESEKSQAMLLLDEERAKTEQVNQQLKEKKNESKKTEKKLRQDEARIADLVGENTDLEDKLKTSKKELDTLRKKSAEERNKNKKEKERDTETIRRLESELSEKESENSKERSSHDQKEREWRNKEQIAFKEKKAMQQQLLSVMERLRKVEGDKAEADMTLGLTTLERAHRDCVKELALLNEFAAKPARSVSDRDALRKAMVDWEKTKDDIAQHIANVKADYSSQISEIRNGSKSLSQLRAPTIPTPPAPPLHYRPPPPLPAAPVVPVQQVQPAPPPPIMQSVPGVIGQRTPNAHSSQSNHHFNPHVSPHAASPASSSAHSPQMSRAPSPPGESIQQRTIPPIGVRPYGHVNSTHPSSMQPSSHSSSAEQSSPWSWTSPMGNAVSDLGLGGQVGSGIAPRPLAAYEAGLSADMAQLGWDRPPGFPLAPGQNSQLQHQHQQHQQQWPPHQQARQSPYANKYMSPAMYNS